MSTNLSRTPALTIKHGDVISAEYQLPPSNVHSPVLRIGARFLGDRGQSWRR